MVRLIRLSALLLCLCFCLCSCDDRGVEDTFYESASEDQPSRQSSPEESGDEGDPYGELVTVAAELLALDGQVIDIFANQALAPYALGLEMTSYGYAVSDRYYTLSEECEYATFSALEELVCSVYSEESGIALRYLNNYPALGGPVFRQDYKGNTQFCNIYNAAFDTDTAGAVISFLGNGAEGVYRMQYSKGGSIYEFEMKATESGYRLNHSLLFLYEDAVISSSSADAVTENAGSAERLVGECLIINLLVDDGDNKWNAETSAELKKMVETAGDYIVSQSKEYGVEGLKFEYLWKETGLDLTAPHYSGGATWASTAFEDCGGYDAYVESLLPEGYKGNYSVMFHFNKQGRSFSVPCDDYFEAKGEYLNEFCVMFYSLPDDNSYFACPALYMHELLHTYGAVDLYEEMLTEKGNALAKVYFDKDIMRYESVDIEACYIGSLTAKLLGWTDSMPVQLKDFLKEQI